MKISLKRNYGFELIFEADNVKVIEDVETREYLKDENGKTDFKKSPIRDISTDALEQITNVLDDMIYYREAEFDSSTLIKNLFEKLPQQVRLEMLHKLTSEYIDY